MIFIVLCSLIAAYNKVCFFITPFLFFVYCVINFFLIEYHFYNDQLQDFSDQNLHSLKMTRVKNEFSKPQTSPSK